MKIKGDLGKAYNNMDAFAKAQQKVGWLQVHKMILKEFSKLPLKEDDNGEMKRWYAGHNSAVKDVLNKIWNQI